MLTDVVVMGVTVEVNTAGEDKQADGWLTVVAAAADARIESHHQLQMQLLLLSSSL